MSEDQREQHRENDYSRRPAGERDRKRHEGFEGMNYEQRRQPYRPQQANNPNSGQNGEQGDDQQL